MGNVMEKEEMKGLMVRGAVAAMVCGALVFDAAAVPTKQSTITVVGYSGATALTNFPVLVRISSSTISGFSCDDCHGDDGSDLSFVGADGAVLAHEIDTWNTSGESTAWVKIPVLTNNVGFVMRWGDANPASMTASDAWNGDYVMVFHMGEESGTCANSTALGAKYDATPMGDTANSKLYDGSDAPVGGARTTATSGKSGYLSIPSYDAENVGSNFTFSGWVRLSQTPYYSRIFSRKENGTDENGWEVEFASTAAGASVRGSSTKCRSYNFKEDKSSIVGEWTHMMIVFNGDEQVVTFYANGVSFAPYYNQGAIAAVVDNARALTIGSGSESRYVVGAFDECRLKKGMASADWAKAEYDTVATAGFLSYGKAKRGMLIIIR